MHELLHLLGGAAGEAWRLERGNEVDAREQWIARQPSHEVVVGPRADPGRGGVAVRADRLVQRLPIATRLRGHHQNPLAGEERQVGVEVALDAARQHHQPARDVGVDHELGIGGEERLWQHEPARRRIVERALHPLHGRRLAGGGREAHHEATQAAHALGSHRIPLVGHRRRADLLRFKRLFELAPGGGQPQVIARLVHRLGDAGKSRDHLRIDLARIGLARHLVGTVKAELHRHELVEPADLRVVAGEELEEARLRAGRPLHTPGPQQLATMGDLLEIEEQVVDPEADPLADRGGLRRLEMRAAKADEILRLECLRGQPLDHGG